MSYDINVYYNPEKFGLREVFCSEEDLSWEFSMFVVWADEEGNLYYATDAGCSCPSPFEDFNNIADLTFASSKASLLSSFRSWGGSTVTESDRLRTTLDAL